MPVLVLPLSGKQRPLLHPPGPSSFTSVPGSLSPGPGLFREVALPPQAAGAQVEFDDEPLSQRG